MNSATADRIGQVHRHSAMIRVVVTMASLWGVISLTGCPRGAGQVPDEAPRHPVAGNVMLDGAPGERVVLTFIPQSGTPGLGGYAIVDAKGRFTVVDYNGKTGLQQGSYDVTFSKRTMLDGSPIPPSVPDGIDTREALPESMTTVQPTRHPYVAEVKGPTESLSYELNSKKR